jgi:cytochrome c oxidase assembly factor CtaG
MSSAINDGPSLLVTLALIVVEYVYVRGWYRLRSGLPDLLSTWRAAAFAIGLFSLWAAVGSPLAAMDHHLLTAHMAQHLLLMTVSAPLILLGTPVIVLLNGLPKRFADSILGPLLQCSPVRESGRALTHPVLCWLVGAAAVIGWHIPVVFELGMRSGLWHEVEHGCFLAAGVLFWWPVVQPWPSLARLPQSCAPLYLFLATLPCDVLSAVLVFCGRVVYPHYASAHRLFNISPLRDQECAGALMWVWVTFVYLVPSAVVTVRVLSPQQRAMKVEVV